MPTQRLFIAIHMPEAYQSQLSIIRKEWSQKLTSKLTWTRPENWHVTLKFLGDVEEETIPTIIEALNAAPFTLFDMQAEGGGYFPPKGSPRVAWLGVRLGADRLVRLARDVNASLNEIGFKKEKRPFRPHLTLARIRRAKHDPWAELIAKIGSMPWPVVRVTHFTLYRSVLGPDGPKYETLAEFGATSL